MFSLESARRHASALCIAAIPLVGACSGGGGDESGSAESAWRGDGFPGTCFADYACPAMVRVSATPAGETLFQGNRASLFYPYTVTNSGRRDESYTLAISAQIPGVTFQTYRLGGSGQPTLPSEIHPLAVGATDTWNIRATAAASAPIVTNAPFTVVITYEGSTTTTQGALSVVANAPPPPPPCGSRGLACCPGLGVDQSCSVNRSVCLGNTCGDCGQSGQACCPNREANGSACYGALGCFNGVCAASAPSCTPGHVGCLCVSGACSVGACANGTCVACGGYSQPCCDYPQLPCANLRSCGSSKTCL